MADDSFSWLKNLPNKLKSSRKRLVFRKWKKNKCRISRRKRKRVEYSIRRKELQIKRKSLDRLSFTILDFADMDCEANPLQEVNEWSYRHELAYWKSRAISLQLENLKLTDLVQKVYNKDHHFNGLLDDDGTGQFASDDGCNEKLKGVRTSNNTYKFVELQHVEPPSKEEEDKRKQQELDLYGPMAPKIKGMETAMQLNYDMYKEKYRLLHWPNIPLNLR